MEDAWVRDTFLGLKSTKDLYVIKTVPVKFTAPDGLETFKVIHLGSDVTPRWARFLDEEYNPIRYNEGEYY